MYSLWFSVITAREGDRRKCTRARERVSTILNTRLDSTKYKVQRVHGLLTEIWACQNIHCSHSCLRWTRRSCLLRTGPQKSGSGSRSHPTIGFKPPNFSLGKKIHFFIKIYQYSRFDNQYSAVSTISTQPLYYPVLFVADQLPGPNQDFHTPTPCKSKVPSPRQ